MTDLSSQFGDIDIYLFDQLLRGRLAPRSRVVDVGCGRGRNIVYLLRSGFEVFGIDGDAEAVDGVRRLAETLAPELPIANFQVAQVEKMPFADGFADTVICNAVLHFARDSDHFQAMLDESWRILQPGGLFFARLASTIGMEHRMRLIEGRHYLLPNGSTRYLVDEAILLEHTARLGGSLLDPLKTTVVQDQRCMTTWVMRKGE